MIIRAGQLRRARSLAIQDDSGPMKVFNSHKSEGRGDQCRPKFRWLDSIDRNINVLKAKNL
jgi:hypothetical protein